MKTHIYILLTFLLIYSHSFGQRLISGKIMDATKEGIPYATVSLYTNTDSLLAATITNEKGFFQMRFNYDSEMKLVISSIGFVTK